MEFDVVIGLEVHCQLNTASKIFASDFNTFGNEPNENISELTLAHPGVMPKTNEKVVLNAVKLGLAFGSEINRFNYFDRKNYFYPDLPKGYQITQDNRPVCAGGAVKFLLKEGKSYKKHEVLIHHVHMEEDAGKSVHETNATLLDYNRAGSPLLEMVTYPCISSPEEAAGFLSEIRKVVRFLGISDGNMEEGSLRADLNVSLKPKGSEQFGTKVEIKNMNSIRFLQKAAEFEIKRQSEILKAGGKVIQETRGFVVETGETVGQRVKETANDYRYFPEPDLAPILISEETIEKLKSEQPELPYHLFNRLVNDFALTEENAYLISEERELADYFFEGTKFTPHFRSLSNWMLTNVRAYLKEKNESISHYPLNAAKLAELVNTAEKGLISNSAAQKLIDLLIASPNADLVELAESNGLVQNQDSDSLSAWVDEVLQKNSIKVEEFKKGKKGLLGMFVGEVMKLSKGSANPQEVNKILLEKLK